MTNFSNLKKSSSQNFDKLLKQVEKLSAPPTFEKEDTDNYWKPTPDKAGNAVAVIRFLPGGPVDGDDAVPFVRFFDHGFQSKKTGKWYIEKSLTTFDEKDPVTDFNSGLWGDRTDPTETPERQQARNQKRRLHYVSNIYVVTDPAKPENEGKVFLFKYGKKIHDKILKMMHPDLESEPRVNPTDLWLGANFKLKQTRQTANIGGRQVSFPNYDESVFLQPAPLFKDDKEIEKVWQAQYSLLEIIDRKNFKTYDELKRKLDDVLGLTGRSTPVRETTQTAARSAEIRHSEDEEDAPWATTDLPKVPVDDGETDPDLAMFERLANE
jgi:hypothetical protein